jgi:vanillate O-demethylase monooxygenase subunit
MTDSPMIERRSGLSGGSPAARDRPDHPGDKSASPERSEAMEAPQSAATGPAGDDSYPLHASSYYPKDHWYVAAYRTELSVDKPLGRQIFGEQVVLFRSEDGEAVGVSGLCVHRYMPLAGGQVIGGNLVCPYHGYAYAGDGRCVHIPTGGTPSPHARLRRYPVVEDGPFVWIWPGSPERAEGVPLPNLSDIGLSGGAEGWRVDLAARLDLSARAPLLVDNLFDLSHIAFIHLESLPGAAGLALLPAVFESDNDRLRVKRTIAGFVAEPDTVVGLTMPPIAGRPVFVSLHTDFYGPAVISSSGPWSNELRNDGEAGASIAKLNFVHIVTPESATSTHYFNVVSRDYLLDDDELSSILVAQTDRVRREDVVWLEEIEKVAADKNAKREISTKADEGALKVRRRLKALIDAEQG